MEKGLTRKQLDQLITILADKALWKRSDELVRFFAILESMGLSDFVVYDPQIIRGLEYYTGTVFEGRDAEGEGRAVFGGGRYDNLVGDVGGDPLPGVGFAMGDVTVSLLLKKYGKIPEQAASQPSVLVTAFDQSLLASSFALANDIRQSGIAVIVYPESVKLQKQLKFADRRGIRCVVIQGPDEAAAGVVTIKDLVTREQKVVPVNEAAKALLEIIS
jgi:histidyl-tRNA synthetase